MWQNEIMLMYPDPLNGYPIEWIEDLRRFQAIEDVIRIEKKDVFPYIKNPDHIAFYRRIEELCTLPQVKSYPDMPEEPWTWLFMIPKKQHEIRKLAPHINHLYHAHNISEVIDIGGGVGYLAQTLNNQYQHHVTTIDMNAEFQKSGVERHNKNSKWPHKVKFRNVKVEDKGEFIELLKQNVLPVGLHTCGKLALDIIRVSSSQKVPALVNFGCCYHTLDLAPDLQNISQFAQDNDPLWMNKFALTLSCRAHRKMDEKDFELKQKVKFFRYAIHILFHDHYGMKGLTSLGNSSPKLYNQSFGVYAHEQMKRIGVEPKQTIDELNDWYNNPELFLTIDRMIVAGNIRNALGRAMEVYLLLDRAIYLEEQGYNVQVEEFFNEEMSPRNIGITATLKNA